MIWYGEVEMNRTIKDKDISIPEDSVMYHYHKHLRNAVENENPRRPGLHVSDLVGECARKPWYRMADDTVKENYDITSIKNFYYGTVIHESFDGMFPVMELKLCVNPYDEISEDEIVDIDKEMKDNPFKWVSGSFDGLMGDTIIDFKTTMKPINKPSPQYVKQINLYSYMYYITTGINIEKGSLLYIVKNSGLRDAIEFQFDLLPKEEVREFMIGVMDEIASEEPPQRVPHIFCTTCQYKKTCEPHGYFDYNLKKHIQ